jgi:hypothetical protein
MFSIVIFVIYSFLSHIPCLYISVTEAELFRHAHTLSKSYTMERAEEQFTLSLMFTVDRIQVTFKI